MRHSIIALATSTVLACSSPAIAQTIYPIDRADILAGARFDLKVEFAAKVDADKVRVTVNGQDAAAALKASLLFIDREDNKDQSAAGAARRGA